MDTVICPECNTNIAVHGDGTLTCSCQFIEYEEPIPDVWEDLKDELETLRDNAISYTD